MAAEDRSIIERLESRGHKPPRVQLRVAAGADAPAPDTEEVALRRNGRYEVLGKLAEGGVGEVLRGRDVDLGRDVALKVLRNDRVGDAEILQRFVDEAQIGAQLQHPGIVPVYELGLQTDGRPFFAMKLVKGQTLAALLKRRKDTGEDRRRFLQVFEQICQTLAYAHARGVVHRDLKPANVMVGGFGEVQVLDWGFSKVLARGGIADERERKEPDVTEIATLRSGAEGSHSIAGSVMGTPAYMPPEQAMGLVEQLDERSDVFCLGAILCEILTGKPPYVGEDKIVKAAQARLDDAHERLADCGADPALVALARRCLAPLRVDRPLDAAEVAAAVHTHLEAVEERARSALIAAAESKAASKRARQEARAQRRAHTQTRWVAAAVLGALLLASGGYAWVEMRWRDGLARTRGAVLVAMEQARELQGAGRVSDALASADRAQALAANTDIDASLRARIGDLLAELQAAHTDEQQRAEREGADATFLAALHAIRLGRADDFDARRTEKAYRDVFLGRGVDVDAQAPEAAAAILSSAHSDIRGEIASALDDWTGLRRLQSKLRDTNATRISALARSLDPDPTRDALRAALATGSLVDVERFVGPESEARLPATTRDVLGTILYLGLGSPEAAVGVLRRLQRERPADLWANFHLGYALRYAGRKPEASPFFAAAVALAPESAGAHTALGKNLSETGHTDESVATLRRALELDPDNMWARYALVDAFQGAGRWDEAEQAAAAFLDARPDDLWMLGARANGLGFLERPVEQLAYAEKVLALDSDWAWGHVMRARALFSLRRADEALVAAERALALDEELPQAHESHAKALLHLERFDEALTSAQRAAELLPKDSVPRAVLGQVLGKLGDAEAAERVLREAVRLRAPVNRALLALDDLLRSGGRIEEALKATEDVLERHPQLALGHALRSNALIELGRYAEARRAAERALAADAELAAGHYALGKALGLLGDAAAALPSLERAVELREENAMYVAHLGQARAIAGRAEEAERHLRRAVELDPDDRIAGTYLAGLLNRGDRPKEALRVTDRYLAGTSEGPFAHLRAGLYAERAWALVQLQRADDAVAAAQEAVRLGPKDAGHYNALAGALAAADRHDEAGDTYRKALGIGGRSLPLREAYARHLAQREQTRPQAVRFARETVLRWPQAATAHECLAEVLESAGRTTDALAACDEALRLDKGLARAHARRGLALSALGRPAEAEASIREALRLDDRSAYAWGQLGYVLGQLERLEDALAAHRRATELAPYDFIHHYNLGVMLSNATRIHEAIAPLRRALVLQPDHAPAQWGLGSTLLRTGQVEEGVALRRMALAARPRRIDWRMLHAAALLTHGKNPEAIQTWQEILRIDPNHADAYATLRYGLQQVQREAEFPVLVRAAVGTDSKAALARYWLIVALDAQGRYVEVREEARALERLLPAAPETQRTWLVPWLVRMSPWLEAYASVHERIDGLLAGTELPTSPYERIALSHRFLAAGDPLQAARLQRDGLTELEAHSIASLRWLAAAAAAARAAAAERDDNKVLDDDERAQWRAQALAWGRKALQRSRASAAEADKPLDLSAWLEMPGLASVRDDAALQKLPPNERKAWETFWQEVRTP